LSITYLHLIGIGYIAGVKKPTRLVGVKYAAVALLGLVQIWTYLDHLKLQGIFSKPQIVDRSKQFC
jgi:hypothetical protein